jgi:hypothetical protein
MKRITFLSSGLFAAAGTLGGYVAQASAAETVQVWGLDPRSESGASCGCATCASCVTHAANKLFANAAAADSGRAHPYCKCLVVPLTRIDADLYTSLFINGGGRDAVDRRYQWVQALFVHVPPAGRTSFMPPDETTVREAPTRREAPTVDATVGRVRIRKRPNGQRMLLADISAAADVTATLAITRGGPTVARRVITGVNGDRRLKLNIPAATKAGPARLRLRLRDDAGTTKVVTRPLQIPPL